ncbi:conjugal transfer protein TraF [Marinobacter xestospongiae]|uniref:Conjugal transfer protein TraF n=1 Tax=Marinobacter xestospongiae TaxID=994319 RepID=A0ABU3W1X1_9GAMM|nr:conjugal transfer protein TraF [Marinobacter xestospongiae]MDV2080330.1 conjugal transfer protein TraF [Marinobacter xestospongiae]
MPASDTVCRLTLGLGVLMVTTHTLAAPSPVAGARATAMAGTGVAVAQPAAANLTNPAMMASRYHARGDEIDLILPSFTVQLADDEDVVGQIDRVQDTIDRLENSARQQQIPQAQAAAKDLDNQLRALDRDTARLDAGLAFSLAVPSPELSVGVFSRASVRFTARGDISDEDLALLQLVEDDPLAAAAAISISDDLRSRGRTLAASIAEVGVAFARSIRLAEDHHLALGVTPKWVRLETFEYDVRVDEFDEDDFDRDENRTDDSQLNLDLGAAYTFGERQQWNAGLAIRNLVPMDLQSRDGLTFDVDPKVTAGLAHRGVYHVVTAELDLTEQPGFGFSDDQRWLALGAEFDVAMLAQVRLGLRHNLAGEDQHRGVEEDSQLTLGLGLSPFGARLDIAAVLSDTEQGGAIELGWRF